MSRLMNCNDYIIYLNEMAFRKLGYISENKITETLT